MECALPTKRSTVALGGSSGECEYCKENSFDPSDRKFLAVAVVAEAVVLNATDSDWAEHGALMDSLGVEVCQLCPQHAARDPGEE